MHAQVRDMKTTLTFTCRKPDKRSRQEKHKKLQREWMSSQWSNCIWCGTLHLWDYVTGWIYPKQFLDPDRHQTNEESRRTRSHSPVLRVTKLGAMRGITGPGAPKSCPDELLFRCQQNLGWTKSDGLCLDHNEPWFGLYPMWKPYFERFRKVQWRDVKAGYPVNITTTKANCNQNKMSWGST